MYAKLLLAMHTGNYRAEEEFYSSIYVFMLTVL